MILKALESKLLYKRKSIARALLLTIPGHVGHVGSQDQNQFSPLGT